jgi:O-antigen/teichoic acid export membrane protein
VTSLSGSFLLSCDRVGLTLWVNVLTLALAAAVLPFTAQWYGALGVAWGTVAVEAFSTAVYFFAAKKVSFSTGNAA